MNKFSLFVLILFFFFCFGCVEQSDSERLLCLNYSSFYSNTVPDCSSPDDCLNKVKSEFKPVSDELNSIVSWEYDKYLFHISKSWYFF